MRLGHSLYIDIAGMQGSQLLNSFFRDKKGVSSDTGLQGSGQLIFTESQNATRVNKAGSCAEDTGTAAAWTRGQTCLIIVHR